MVLVLVVLVVLVVVVVLWWWWWCCCMVVVVVVLHGDGGGGGGGETIYNQDGCLASSYLNEDRPGRMLGPDGRDLLRAHPRPRTRPCTRPQPLQLEVRQPLRFAELGDLGLASPVGGEG